ncbi:hypothetical protein Syun_010892 [Stephania yunnanensis]|uniref:Alanine--tRNA ligase n=1 Tax=Stephania yunnanensis TaxID=152371 RepID=A0AAP0JWJ3_9MAGN
MELEGWKWKSLGNGRFRTPALLLSATLHLHVSYSNRSFASASAAARATNSLLSISPPHSLSSSAAMPGFEHELQSEWPADRVRDTFFKFFQEKTHVDWKSSPVVPVNDPTLLFANAGMNQFKPIFLGTADPNTALSKLKRACNTQKCIRAGGKHNDLDDVGKDTYHHTFFEMLGNWSFGDYFKQEAIEWAWELLTKVYGLPSDRIYATYFGGDEKLGLPADDEARNIWKKFLPLEHILPFGCKDNFWEMGDTGPCGPCTEIHFDRIGNRDAASLVNNDDPTCIEIWNLVFIQFNRESDGSLKPLPAKHVDTGLGFERLTSILQNKMSNYDTDVFMPIFNAIQKETGARPYTGKVGVEDVDQVDMAYRVVADHIRTLSFAIADGSCPGNEGREYVLRRILRRAVRYGGEVLKAEDGFFSRLVGVVVKVMGDVFPELKQHESHITDTIKSEEDSFGKTLLKGIERFKKAALEVGIVSCLSLTFFSIICGLVIPDAILYERGDAFVLWDTYGFPLDLTQLMAEERGLAVDVEGYNIAMEEAKQRSRNAQNKQGGGAISMDADATSELHKRGIAATDDSAKFIWFKGHESVVKAIYSGATFLDNAGADEEVGIVLETTNFYAEQGGQIFDIGSLGGTFGSFQVSNVQIFGGYVLHIGSVAERTKNISVGDKVICKVDYERRSLIAPNHTCTHMLNLALREVLGDHVDQKGSIVLPEKLRFDFSHGKLIPPDDLRKIESKVNEQIQDKLEVFAKEVTLADAKRIVGLRAVFGEVYPDPVRVVAIGTSVDDLLANPDNPGWLSISTELCGGTHITNTREAKAFALLSEEGIAKGIRRITAVTTDCASKAKELALLIGQEITEASNSEGSVLEKIVFSVSIQKVAALKSRVETATIPAAMKADLKGRINGLQDLVKKAQKKIAAENLQKAIKTASEVAEVAASQGKSFCISRVDVGLDTAAVREAVNKVMEKKEMSIMVFSSDDATNKAVVYAGVPPKGDKYKGFEVSEWVAAAMGPLKGKCGKGKGGLAQGQGTDASHLKAAMDLAEDFATMKLK